MENSTAKLQFVTMEQVRKAYSTKLCYATTYKVGRDKYSSYIYAVHIEEAMRIAEIRGMGEEVLGVMDPPEVCIPDTLPERIHFAAFLSYIALKAGTITADQCLGDRAVLHELIHELCSAGTQGYTEIEQDAVNHQIHQLMERVPGLLP